MNAARVHPAAASAQCYRQTAHGTHVRPDADGHHRALASHARISDAVAPGTDHAGIATQMMVERQLAREGKKRRDMGREKFIERVWEWKKQYGGNIIDQMKRLGASVDWDREYFTMDENLSRAVREVFVRLYEEGLIYRGKYIVNWCPRCETAISDLEVKHEDVPGKLWEIRYPVVGTNEFITVATTRPETMLGDTAIAVNTKDERYHASARQESFAAADGARDSHHHRRTGAAGIRHRRGEGDAGARSQRLPGWTAPQPAADRSDGRKRPHEPERRASMRDSIATKRASRVLEDLEAGNFLVGEKDHTIPLGKCDRCGTVVEPRLSTQWFIKIASRWRSAPPKRSSSGEITIDAGQLPADLLELDAQHPRLVHLAATVVGTPHSRVALQVRRRSSSRARRRRSAQSAAAGTRAGHAMCSIPGSRPACCHLPRSAGRTRRATWKCSIPPRC